MIDKLNALTLNLLKTNVSIVLIFYASGFLSFLAYYRVLGLPYIAGDLQTYTELAGRNIIVILQSFILFITQPNYFIKNVNALNWVGYWIYVWGIAITLLGVIAAILKLIPVNRIIITLRQSRYTRYTRLGLIAFSVLSVFYIEIQPLYVKNVLQPASYSQIQTERKNILNYEKLKGKTNYKEREKIAGWLNEKPNNQATKEFFVPKTADQSGNDDKRTTSLIFFILIASITAIILAIYRKHTFIKWLIYFYVFAQAILIPFNYGILGSNYEYPVIVLEYMQKEGKEQEKPVHKEGVFLLAKSHDNLIIYDRLNFFEISYIPQSSVIKLEQIFTGSPFSNCNKTNGEFTPCEMYAINQSQD